jgi:hypothetical protein
MNIDNTKVNANIQFCYVADKNILFQILRKSHKNVANI